MDDAQRLAQIRRRLERDLETAGLRSQRGGDEGRYAPMAWAHVPLLVLLREAGNNPVQVARYKWQSGHTPVHASKSGRCLVVWTNEGAYRCFSPECRERHRGDAVALLMELTQCRRQEAVDHLTRRFGRPPSWRPPPRHSHDLWVRRAP